MFSLPRRRFLLLLLSLSRMCVLNVTRNSAFFVKMFIEELYTHISEGESRRCAVLPPTVLQLGDGPSLARVGSSRLRQISDWIAEQTIVLGTTRKKQ